MHCGAVGHCVVSLKMLLRKGKQTEVGESFQGCYVGFLSGFMVGKKNQAKLNQLR